jgi:NDP-hexose-3-ketoreductase
MTQTIHIGVLGCSRFAQRSLIPALQERSDCFKVVGIGSRNAEKANQFAAEFKTTPYPSYEALLSASGVQAVYIPLPNALHAEWVDRALDRGLHVLVEKSLACSAKDVRRLCEKAEASGCVLIENFQFRFHRQLKVLLEILAEGRIGALRCVRAQFGFPPFPDADNIRYQASLGGGALLDAGAYTIKIAQILLGPDVHVAAAALHRDEARGVDLWGGGFIRQSNGPLFAEVAFGFENYYQCGVELWGSKGKLTTNRLFTAPPGYAPEIVIETLSGREVVTVEPDNHFHNMLQHFHALILDPTKAADEYRQNVCQAELVEQLRRKTVI